MKTPFELIHEMFEITRNAHVATNTVDVWYAECMLQDVGRYFSENSTEYLIRHPEYVDNILRTLRLTRYHLSLCETVIEEKDL